MENIIHWPDGNEFDVGVVVGRFQVPTFHEGHKYLLDNVQKSHKYMMIIVGVSPVTGSRSNPMDYLTRMEMLRNMYPNALIYPIADVHNNALWSSTLDRIIKAPFEGSGFTIRLYGGRDSFLKQYNGILTTYEIPNLNNVSGTAVRESIVQPIDSEDFRKGIIFAANKKQYPTIAITVDIALTKGNEVLLGKKSNSDKWRFPGGFIDLNDENFEAAAKRELFEETGMICDIWKYLGTYKINDWRYSGPNECLFTTFFEAEYQYGMPKAGDDIAVVDWFSPQIQSEFLVPEHRILLRSLRKVKGIV